MERTIAFIALFAALTAALAFVPALTLAVGVPITAQTMGVMLAGCVLGPWRAFLAILIFLILVALGVPLLAGGRGGLGVFFLSPSAGYLIGWPIGALVIGAMIHQLKAIDNSFLRGFVACLVGGIIVIHITGVLGLAIILQKTVLESFWLTLPFIPGDILKAILAATIYWMLCTNRPNSLF